MDLSVRIGSLTLKNPLIAASGCFGYGVEYADLVDLASLGGVAVKGLFLAEREGHPAPRIVETPAGMLNAIGLQGIGVHRFVAEKLPELRRFKCAIFANVFGYSIGDYVEVIRTLEDAEGLSGYELNISCPNVEHGGIEYSTDPALTAEVVRAARQAAKRPLWVKLSPNVNAIGLIAKAAEEAGADALVIANTYPALCIDVHSRKSRLGSTTGGLSGAAIRPITVRLVYEACKTVKIPVIGLGGIEKPADVAEYLLAGASATEVGTAHFVDPRASTQLVDGVRKWCEAENILDINDLRGALQR